MKRLQYADRHRNGKPAGMAFVRGKKRGSGRGREERREEGGREEGPAGAKLDVRKPCELGRTSRPDDVSPENDTRSSKHAPNIPPCNMEVNNA
jgi:hypothetical protein